MNRLGIAIVMACAAGAAGAEGFMPWTDVVKMADGNADGMLTPTEVMYFKEAGEYPGFMPFMTDHFKGFDTDQDGMVSKAELDAAMQKYGMTDTQMSKAFLERQGFMPRSAQ